jgi:hypothetical protein
MLSTNKQNGMKQVVTFTGCILAAATRLIGNRATRPTRL